VAFVDSYCFRIITYLDVTPRYSFLLHCGDDYRAEALRRHGRLNDVGVVLSFFCRRFTQINTDYFKKLKLKDYFLPLFDRLR